MDLEAKEPLRGFRHREDFACEGKKVLVEIIGARTGDMPPVERSEASETARGFLSTEWVNYQVRIW